MLMKCYGVLQIKISAYNSKANGVVKHGHFTIRQAIIKLCQGSPHQWHQFVPPAFFADCVTVRRATGFLPYYLLHRTDPVLLFDLTKASFLFEGFRTGMNPSILLLGLKPLISVCSLALHASPCIDCTAVAPIARCK